MLNSADFKHHKKYGFVVGSDFPTGCSMVNWAFCHVKDVNWRLRCGVDSQPTHVCGFRKSWDPQGPMIEVWMGYPNDLANLHCPSWKVLDGQGLQSTAHQWQGMWQRRKNHHFMTLFKGKTCENGIGWFSLQFSDKPSSCFFRDVACRTRFG